MKMLGAFGGMEKLRDYSCFILGGTPKEGQSLEEVRSLLLAEIEKLKSGNFSDDLLPSIINNAKLNYFTRLESNQARANLFVDTYINEIPWEQQVGYLDRISGITKQQVVDFARRHFGQNYVSVLKRQGEDKSLKKIDKPQITPIPANRDQMSQFVKDIQNSDVKPIEPRFVDFQKDLTFGKTKKNLPYIYVKNTENGRFSLSASTTTSATSPTCATATPRTIWNTSAPTSSRTSRSSSSSTSWLATTASASAHAN